MVVLLAKVCLGGEWQGLHVLHLEGLLGLMRKVWIRYWLTWIVWLVGLSWVGCLGLIGVKVGSWGGGRGRWRRRGRREEDRLVRLQGRSRRPCLVVLPRVLRLRALLGLLRLVDVLLRLVGELHRAKSTVSGITELRRGKTEVGLMVEPLLGLMSPAFPGQ